jgi:hypothetical protein
MLMSAKQKRVDRIWVQLTPKDWAIWLADHIRKYQCQDDFMKAAAQGTLEKSPQFIPLFALARQAQGRQPGWKPEDIKAREKVDRKLRTEFLALKTLIVEVNKAIYIKAETNAVRDLLASVEMLILQDAFGRTAKKAAEWIKGHTTADTHEEGGRQLILEELAAYTDGSFAKTPDDYVPTGGGLRLRFPSLIEGLVEVLTVPILDVFGHKAAVQVIQERYFDGHPILFRDIEATLEEEIQKILATVATLNKYLKIKADLFSLEWDQGAREKGVACPIPTERENHLAMDIEAIQNRAQNTVADPIADVWVQRATDQAVTDILDETGEARAFFWNRFRKAAGVQL